jgi:hypothetical protein
MRAPRSPGGKDSRVKSIEQSHRASAHANRTAELDRLGVKHVPCKTCGFPTDKTGTGLCDGCWEVEHRLATYLRDGGRVAVSFVARALADAAEAR